MLMKDFLDWLKEKESAERFGLKALYHPLSHIPIEAWKAGQSNTNAKEAKQGDVLLEGKGGTLIAAMSIGERYDFRHISSIHVMEEVGINHYYHLTTDVRRAELSLNRSGEFASDSNYEVRMLSYNAKGARPSARLTPQTGRLKRCKSKFWRERRPKPANMKHFVPQVVQQCRTCRQRRSDSARSKSKSPL